MTDENFQELETQVKKFLERCSNFKQKISEMEEANSFAYRQEFAIKTK